LSPLSPDEVAEEQEEEEKVRKKGDNAYIFRNIVVEIVEVMQFRSPAGRLKNMIAYRIRDRNFVSPVAHFWMDQAEDVKKYIKQVVEQYLAVKGMIK